ncbi:hypothetical protein ABPG72_011290 [Tetrahymena utriculariae]
MTDNKNKVITWLELMIHTTKHDCWILVDDKVFDVTTYLAEHPGGDDILLKCSGRDSTQQFRDINHTDYAISLRDQRLIGVIEQGEQPKEYKEWLEKTSKQNNKYTWAQVKQHNKQGDSWVVIDGKVYDLSSYIEKHPGGPSPILSRAGKDATRAFEEAKHPKSAYVEREDLQIGVVYGPQEPEISNKEGSFSIVHILLAIVLAAVGYYFFVLNK